VRYGLIAAVALVLAAAACSNNPDNHGKEVVEPGDGGEVGEFTDAAGPVDSVRGEVGCGEAPGQVCCPGMANGCTEDGRYLLLCNETGKGFDMVECVDEGGTPTICLTTADYPKGICTKCIPGVKSCKDDDIVLQCTQFGEDWEEFTDCNGEATGQVCVQGGCVALCEVNQKLNMYMGCDFWAADLDNAFVPGGRAGYYDAAGAQYAVVVSNPHPKYPATVEIETIEGPVLNDSDGLPFPTEPLLPGELRIYNLPRRDVDGTLIAPLAYRIEATIPITAYQFNPLENVDVFSNDASLLIPSNVMGKYYFVMTREQTFDELRSFVTIMAVRAGETKVTVDVTAPTLVGEIAATGEVIPPLEPGDTYTATLKQFDVLNLESNEIGSDMTGTLVLANRDVAVFGGSEASNAPNTNHCDKENGVCEWDGESKCKTNEDCTAKFNTCCADHLEMQLFPVKAWGKRYQASKTFPRNKEKDVYRIIAAENNTKVTTIPPQANIPVLEMGEWVDFESLDNFEIVASKPIMVGQFLAAEQAPDPNVNGVPQPGDAGIGDPAFLLLVPVEQMRQDYVFLAPNKYELDYLTVVAPDGAKVWFDCKEIDPKKIVESCDPLDPDEFELFGTGEFMTTKFLIEDGVHRIYADKPVGLYVYGYDQYVSYAYPAGLNISDLGLIKEPGQQ